MTKRNEWLIKKIYDKASNLLVGNIEINEFIRELKSLYRKADEIEWK